MITLKQTLRNELESRGLDKHFDTAEFDQFVNELEMAVRLWQIEAIKDVT